MVTVQSVTRHPHSPCSRVSRTVSSTALKKAYGMAPSSTSRRKSTPEPGGAGSTRRPTVARNGLPSLRMNSTAFPEPAGRSTHSGVVARNVTSMPYSSARVAWTISFWTSP